MHCSLLILQYVWLKKKDNCCGSPLIAPSVVHPIGTLPPQILSHIKAEQITFTQTQSRIATAAVHFIKAKRILQRNPVLQLAVTACVIRRPEQMKHGAVCWSRLLHLLKGCFHHWCVIWNLFLDTFAPFQTN